MAASTRVALSSVLGTISDTANAVSSLVNTTTKSIGMLDAFVTKASDEQRKQHLKDGLSFNERLYHEHAQEMSDLKIKADEFCNKSDRHREHYNGAYDELKALIQPVPQAA